MAVYCHLIRGLNACPLDSIPLRVLCASVVNPSLRDLYLNLIPRRLAMPARPVGYPDVQQKSRNPEWKDAVKSVRRNGICHRRTKKYARKTKVRAESISNRRLKSA